MPLWPGSRTVTLIPSCANSIGGSPYSLANQHAAPLVSEENHSASRTLTTNQPSVTGASPEPASSSLASFTQQILAVQATAVSPGSACANDAREAGGGCCPIVKPVGNEVRYIGGMRSPLGRTLGWGANATWPFAELRLEDGEVLVRLRSALLRRQLGRWFPTFRARVSETTVERVRSAWGFAVGLRHEDERRSSSGVAAGGSAG